MVTRKTYAQTSSGLISCHEKVVMSRLGGQRVPKLSKMQEKVVLYDIVLIASALFNIIMRKLTAEKCI